MRSDTATLSRETTKTQAAAETLALDLLSSGASDGAAAATAKKVVVDCAEEEEDCDSDEDDGCGCFGAVRGRRSVSVSVSTPDIWRISSRHRVYGVSNVRYASLSQLENSDDKASFGGAMFKWKVGAAAKKGKQLDKLNNGQTSVEQQKNNKNSKEAKKDREKDAADGDSSPSKRFGLFSSDKSSPSAATSGQQPQPQQAQPNGILKNYDPEAMSRVGQRLAMSNIPLPAVSPSTGSSNGNMNVSNAQLNLSSEHIYTGPPSQKPAPNSPPPPMPKPAWRQQTFQSQPPPHAPPPHQQKAQEEEAIPSDSLYGPASDGRQQNGGQWNKFDSRTNLSHWSSHGYLAKPPPPPAHQQPNNNSSSNNNNRTLDPGYVFLKRHGDQMLMAGSSQTLQPHSLPFNTSRTGPSEVTPGAADTIEPERKYFSVRGFSDMTKFNQQQMAQQLESEMSKYYSVDARYNSVKTLPADLRAKLRQMQDGQPAPSSSQQQQQQVVAQYHQPPAPPPRHTPAMQRSVSAQPQKKSASDLEKAQHMGGSASWLEWTQQLQAYIAWVNSQLRKRPELKPVQDLRTDLQSGEVLAQLIEIISGEKIAGIEYNPESLQGMRENLERILQFMSAKRIRMHQITSREILEGNLKAVMRLILALAAHYKPQSVRHHDVSFDSLDRHGGVRKESDKEGSSTQKQREDSSSLNQTQDSLFSQQSAASSSSVATPSASSSNVTVVKRTPSLNDPHYARNSRDAEAGQIYENLHAKSTVTTNTTSVMTESMSTQTEAKSPLQQNQRAGLQKEGSFVRTGSGRKLPKLPDKPVSSPPAAGASSTLPTRSRLEEHEYRKAAAKAEAEAKAENRKSKPKALEFWESLETVDSGDFRYNTIHRMSVGRRMLPKPPGGELPSPGPMSAPGAAMRSLSLDRSSARMAASCLAEAEKASLDSSFSGETLLSPRRPRKTSESGSDVMVEAAMHLHHSKLFAPDGCSLQSSDGAAGTASPGQPSPPSSDTRGEVEGSSDNNSPPTSVIQGNDNGQCSPASSTSKAQTNPSTLDWLRSIGSVQQQQHGRKDIPMNPSNGFHNLEEEVMYLRSLHRAHGDGTSSSKQSDSLSDSGRGGGAHVPYEVLLQDLSQAKRQLLELHSLLASNLASSLASSESASEESSGLTERLACSESRCQRLSLQVRVLRQECASMESGKDASGQMRQNLVRATMARQTLEAEKKELLRRVDELEASLCAVRLENGEKDKQIRSHKLQMEDFAKKQCTAVPSGALVIDSDLRSHYEEELTVAKDAISNLRTSFSDSDPNQHILDTLEQCISVIIEKIQNVDHDKSSSRLSSLEFTRANEVASHSQSSTTKILYFTNRSVTPFMSSINKKIGDITLRDFKALFDRPGFFRFHFKSVDQEFGMVKEEITQDDAVLPGADGKVVAWVDED